MVLFCRVVGSLYFVGLFSSLSCELILCLTSKLLLFGFNGDVARLILGQVVEEADRIGLQVRQGLGVLVDPDDETLGLHRNRRDVTTDVEVTLTLGRRRETIDRTVHTVPRFDADARHDGLVVRY